MDCNYHFVNSFPFDFKNQMEFHLVQNRKENCHIPFNLKGNGNIVFSVYQNDGIMEAQLRACYREALVSRTAVRLVVIKIPVIIVYLKSYETYLSKKKSAFVFICVYVFIYVYLYLFMRLCTYSCVFI